MEEETKNMCPVCMKCEMNEDGTCKGCNMNPCEADKCTCPEEMAADAPATM